jgi:hypothetical protein
MDSPDTLKQNQPTSVQEVIFILFALADFCLVFHLLVVQSPDRVLVAKATRKKMVLLGHILHTLPKIHPKTV